MSTETECNVCHQPIPNGEGHHFGRFHFHDGECYDLATQRLIHFLDEVTSGKFEDDEPKPICPDCGADMVDGACWYCENKPGDEGGAA